MSKLVNEDYPKTGKPMSDNQLKKIAEQQYIAEQKSETDTKSFPTEIVDLPSRGKFYADGHPLSTGKVEMKYMVKIMKYQ